MNLEKVHKVGYNGRDGGCFDMKKILVVDDSLFMRMILKNVIQELGYEIAAEASNGMEALTKYEEIKPDLVTLDITMPEMDGMTALEEIRSRDPEAKVIMVSAMGQQALLIRAVSMGASDFIVKPFNKDRVREALKKAFAS
ncbi:CheY [Paenibacillus mucilaginosus 3016]|uniref:CheY n=3 Tax=Paenibacillus mucilaginosus TaxID=61624 RepID=H6NJK5_9BACL|nr:CheY [Paenibacillus mucilaginosus KNP414]AFC29685.1 CheY [Paenibacillus mucilaginosus 3016]